MQKNKENNPIAPIDALVKIKISDDALEAKLCIEPPKNGGAEANTLIIDTALKKEKITYGLITETIEKVKEHPQYETDFLIAKGVAPVHGEDGSIRYLFKTKLDGRPKELKDGTVDYRDLGLIENVRKGQTLCTIVHATKGTDGMTVTGRKLMAIAGRSVDSPMGMNTEFNEDQTELRAASNGHVSLNGTKVHVATSFIVENDVDNSTGNIKFVGNVQINGNVLEGFSVEAEGDISIEGGVEGADIKSGGNIVIRGGVVGRGHSKLECKGNLNSIFLENCEVNVGESIRVENIMNCNVKCGLNIELTGTRSKIVGGRCIAGKNISANFIGTPANLLTDLVLGSAPELVTKKTALLNEIEQLEQQIDKLNKIVTLLKQYEDMKKIPPDKKVMLEKSIFSLDAINSRYEAVKTELSKLNPLIEETGNGKVTCYDIIYPGVKLTIGIAHMEVINAITCSTFTNIKGEIVVNNAV